MRRTSGSRATAALVVVVLAAAAASPGCDKRDSGPVASETVCDLNKVPVHHLIPMGSDSGRLSWDVHVSPEGERFAVKRDVSERVNVHKYRIDVDGSPGPRPFDTIGVQLWSRDGRTFAYVGRENLPQPGAEFLVVEGNVLGPFHSVRNLCLGAGGGWAFVHEDNRSGEMKKTLVVNGTETPLSFLFGDMRLGASGEPAFRIEEHKWRDLAGREVPVPPGPDEPLQKVPTAEVKMNLIPGERGKRKPGEGGEPKRQKLTVNGRDVGTFDQVLGRGRGKEWQPGYQQADGRILVYAIDRRNLMRLRVKP